MIGPVWCKKGMSEGMFWRLTGNSDEKLQDGTMDKIRALQARRAMSWSPMVLGGSTVCT